ncbi:PREDICTED: HERV-H LTR-associating protein 2 [Colobus angolensis palliatus]|uniref:HERV-H LTR-associating protein 2 n=1 Tax=Colobus angolensis palliatus TaxID=336983 RepID=UPI0005F52684|nr:PREDICTED: HERV-H LTR-associating protein 2 [Colobus angolensis palliatus]
MVMWNILKPRKHLFCMTNMSCTRHEGTDVFLPHSHIISEWISRRLSLLDEGIYTCYVGTAIQAITNKVVLKVGVFLTPMMKYEKRNTNSFLICSVLSVYPRPIITWKMDNTLISENNMEETGSLGPFSINSTLNITGSNSSYECTIENSLLKQTWTGRWTMKDGLHKMQTEHVSLSCELVNDYFSPNQDFKVTWSRMESGISSILAYYLSSSQNTTFYESRFSWNKELKNQSDFSMNLMDLRLSDSGEYLCNISSDEYTLLTIHTVHIEPSQETASDNKGLWILVASLILVAGLILVLCLILLIRKVKSSTERHRVPTESTHDDNASDNAEENMNCDKVERMASVLEALRPPAAECNCSTWEAPP